MVKRQTSAVDRYLDLPYHITLVQDGEENGGARQPPSHR